MPAPLPGGEAARCCPAPRRSPQSRARTGAAGRLSHDCGGFPGPAETLQHPVRPLLAPAAAGDHRYDFILLLLAPQAPEREASHQIRLFGSLKEPR